ncbi:hypothetical protein [Clostridium sp. E02]|uniref:hypothetical protein n=1 Tax=Clostridium sp. E02 TaxID=2487134 RepID=UPI000F540853|nr:hypothetical protein [Clostridium sp. E02]
MNNRTDSEEIMRKRKEAKKGEEQELYTMENDIQNGFIVVKYKKFDVEEKEIMDGSLSMIMPTDFELMDEELAEIKYPGEDRPDYIYSGEDTTVNLTFTMEESGQIDNDEVEEAKNILEKQIGRLYPSSKIEDSQTIQAGEKNISFFGFDVPLLDGKVYNLMFFMEYRGSLLMGAFNCSIHQKKQWKKVIFQMLMTIREKSQPVEPVKEKELGEESR